MSTACVTASPGVVYLRCVMCPHVATELVVWHVVGGAFFRDPACIGCVDTVLENARALGWVDGVTDVDLGRESW